MTQAQLVTRQERAAEGVLIASRADEGFRVYSIDNPKQGYFVGYDGERLTCTCPDFEFHKSDPDWRCKHILAVEPNDTSFLPEALEPVEEVPQSRSEERRVGKEGRSRW